jgi:hypothetical protein
MRSNVRIAKELVRIAHEMVAGQAFYKEIDGKWSVHESDVADKLGFYRRFTGTIDYGQTKATVKGADFGVYAHGHIVFERGTWIDGTWSGGRWEGGTWLNGVWNDGDWYKGTWKNGVWKNGMFGHDETKKSDWMNGTFENGVFETGNWHGGVWKGGKWSDWCQNFWMKGTDGNGVVHGRGECPLKWNEDSNVVVASELVRIARELVASQENFGSYSIDFDKNKRTFTVYFILKDDAVESKALKNAKACRYEIKMVLSGNERISVTNLENNKKSFSFNIVVDDEDEKTASSEDEVQFRFADDGDVESEEGDNSDTSQQKEHGSEKPKDDAGDNDSKQDEADSELFEEIEKTVSRICKEHKWDVEK